MTRDGTGIYRVIGKTSTSFTCPYCKKKHGFKGQCFECFSKRGY